MVVIDIQLPEELAAQARAAGLLSSEKIAALIESELERRRQAAADRLSVIMDELQAAARQDFGDMTEDEFMQLVNDVVHEVRAEKGTRQGEQSE